MSDDPLEVQMPAPSMNMDVDNGVLATPKDFSNALTTELSDTEIGKAMEVIVSVQKKYAHKTNSVPNLDMLRDEITTKMAEIGILVAVDPTPCFYGEAPVVDIIGKVAGDAIHDHGFDHERKMYEVRKATERGEDYYGQKEKQSSNK